MASKQFTINQVRKEFLEEAHLTSAKFPENISEFDALGLEEEYSTGFKAPFVKKSHIKIALNFEEQHEIKLNGTVFIVGSIDHVIVENNLVEETGHINYSNTDSVSVAGLDTYYSITKIERKPYARVPNVKENKVK
jgi:flavin reductase (DIM6/NTAB) family NADH-FMN oxidoreductase RutF